MISRCHSTTQKNNNPNDEPNNKPSDDDKNDDKRVAEETVSTGPSNVDTNTLTVVNVEPPSVVDVPLDVDTLPSAVLEDNDAKATAADSNTPTLTIREKLASGSRVKYFWFIFYKFLPLCTI